MPSFFNKSIKLWHEKQECAILQWLSLIRHISYFKTFLFSLFTFLNTVYPLPNDKNTTYNILWCSVELQIGKAVCWGRWDQRGEEVGAKPAARPARSGTTQGGVRSLAGVQGSWSAARAWGWGSRRHSEALPEWTETFSSAHKGHFSLPQHNTAQPQW